MGDEPDWSTSIAEAWPEPPRWMETEELREALRFGLAPGIGHRVFTDSGRGHRRYFRPARHIYLDEARKRFAPDFLRCERCGAEERFDPPNLPDLREQLIGFITAHRHAANGVEK